MSFASSTPWISAAFETSAQADFDTTAAISSQIGNLSFTDSESVASSSPGGHLASFVLLLSGLEQALHDELPLILDSDTSFGPDRSQVAAGASFSVERVEWSGKNQKRKYNSRWGKHVALKYVLHRSDSRREAANWKQLLLEIRALLHEPIRYHPNIVRLLGLSWDAAEGTGSPYPVLVLELSELGTLAHFQINAEGNLPFDVKKKLCWDVSKGISILHACGIIHGDLKHENVLIYPNLSADAEIMYTAKIADFGGSVMDLQTDKGALQYRTPTIPYEAPEFYEQTDPSEEELKLTDVYSLGLLIWRTMLDGKNPFIMLQSDDGEPLTKSDIHGLKQTSELFVRAKETLAWYSEAVSALELDIVNYVLENTIRENPGDRSLVKAIAGLQAKAFSEIDDIIQSAAEAGRQYEAEQTKLAPGNHGITPDSIGIYLAKMDVNNGDHDYQKKGPGYRSKLSPPPPGAFLFDPQRLKQILDWDLQGAFVRDLEFAVAVSSKEQAAPTQITPALASFFLFQCYCHELGTVFDPAKACQWLKYAASCDEECEQSYLARAWCWRVHEAFGVPLDVSPEQQRDWIYWAIIHGHRKCIAECNQIASKHASSSNSEETQKWLKDTKSQAVYALNTACGGVGMPFYFPRKLRRPYNVWDLQSLDKDIQDEMAFRGVDSVNDIYVNHRGDGILHMIAGLGELCALKHVVEKYDVDIDHPNQERDETPLLSACRGGHLACAIYLLDRGAKADGGQFANETPLYWLSSFSEDDIPDIASRLVREGASLAHAAHPSVRSVRSPIRNQYMWADYENLHLLPVSPLSRAVIMNSLPAVRALLALGADPLEGLHGKLHANTGLSVCPVVMASVLTLPDILEVMLSYLDARTPTPTRIISEMEMLRIALQLKVTMADHASLHSRVTRHGVEYKSAMTRTLRMLHDREQTFVGNDNEAAKATATNLSVEIMTSLVRLGRYDIVENLLQLGHAVNGNGYSLPIVEAVKLNHEPLFRLLTEHGADVAALYDVSPECQQRSLLQVLAERPRSSRGGIAIAEYLLKKGVPVDPPAAGKQKPAFATAVRKQDFELADLLLVYGADVDFTYVNFSQGVPVTILGELMYSPREKSVDSIRYLIGLDKKPSFIVSPENSWTVFHHAVPLLKTDTEKHVRSQMVRHLLSESTYGSEEVVNYRVPEKNVIPVLFTAVAMANLELAIEFLDKGLGQGTIEYQGMNAITVVEWVLRQHSQSSDQLRDLLGEDKVTRDASAQRYRLLLNRLLGIQAGSNTSSNE